MAAGPEADQRLVLVFVPLLVLVPPLVLVLLVPPLVLVPPVLEDELPGVEVGLLGLLDVPGGLSEEVGGVEDVDCGGGVSLVGPCGGLVGLVVGTVVPGGMYVPGGIGVPGGSTTGFVCEPGGGTIVTTRVPSGATATTTVPALDGSGASSLGEPGTALPELPCGPDDEFALPALRSGTRAGVASSAMPPNAVASTTPLAASST